MNKVVNHYVRRTVGHIHRVQLRAAELVEKAPELFQNEEYLRAFIAGVMMHDNSKFNFGIWDDYKTMSYKKDILKEELFDGEKRNLEESIRLHYELENHHPEGWCSETLTNNQVYEAACDLQAMSDEFNNGNPFPYFEDTWLVKHKNFITETRVDVEMLMRKCFSVWERRDDTDDVLKAIEWALLDCDRDDVCGIVLNTPLSINPNPGLYKGIPVLQVYVPGVKQCCITLSTSKKNAIATIGEKIQKASGF